jgi:ABC-2 type transport system ATP-binding protein
MPVQPAALVRDDALRLEDVRKSFDAVSAVRGLNLSVPRGSIYGLLGPNGAGKTTTIRMIMGILKPDEGRVRVLGDALTEATKDRIGYLPEERGLYPAMKVWENLVFFGELRGLSGAEARRSGREWLQRLGMGDTANRRLQELSKGNQQKIQFAATVMHGPELLVLDEPFSGLDPVNQDLMRTTILSLAEGGTTIVLSTHLMDEVERLCSHLTLIHRGTTVAGGRLEDVKRQHGGETIVVEVEGDASPLESHSAVLDCRRNGRVRELTLTEGADPSSLLAEVAPRVRIRRFEVRTASLHSIFVRLVSADPAAEADGAAASVPHALDPVAGARR